MGYWSRRIFILSMMVTAALCVTGCDLFSPAKKETKSAPVEAAPAPQEVAVAPVSDDQGPIPAHVIARVGDWTLTGQEFDQRLSLLKQGLKDFNEKDAQTRRAVLKELVNQQLLVKEAENSDIGQQKDIKDAVEDFRRTVLMQALAERITKSATVTAEEAQKYYDENKNIFLKWKVRQIVVPDEATAKTLLVQVLQGGDFAVIAKDNSKDKTAAEGGLIEDPAKLPLEVQKVIMTLEASGTSTVFKAPGGYYIVHVDEKKLVPFSEIKDSLILGLTTRKQQSAILEYIDKLAQKNKVEINEALLGQ